MGKNNRQPQGQSAWVASLHGQPVQTDSAAPQTDSPEHVCPEAGLHERCASLPAPKLGGSAWLAALCKRDAEELKGSSMGRVLKASGPA